MKNIVEKVPIPLLGVSLASAALGNLLQSYSELFRIVFGIWSAFCFLLVLLKFILFWDKVKEDFQNPIMASVAGTGSMALMLLSVYAKSLIGGSAVILWYAGVLLHLLLILYFTVRFLFKLDIKKVFASYYIVYVGIVTASVAAPAFAQEKLGTMFFWFGYFSAGVLFFLITYRYIFHQEIPAPAQPVICIYAAPFSLLIAGYVQSVADKSVTTLLGIYSAACILYLFSLIKMIGCLKKLPFFPSYASFTFPFVISAIASKQAAVFLTKVEQEMPVLFTVASIQTVIATLIVIYVSVRFLKFLLIQQPSLQK